MRNKMNVGDTVEYRSFKTDRQPQCVSKVIEILPEGIPSYKKPVVKLEDKPGYVAADRCRVIIKKEG